MTPLIVILNEVEYIDSKYDLEHQYKRNPLIIGFKGDIVRSGENINQMQLLLIQMCEMHLLLGCKSRGSN